MGDPVLADSLLALLQTQVQNLPEHRVADIFKPLATPAAAEKNIAWLTLGITGAIFVVVAGLIVYTMWRFRRKPEDDSGIKSRHRYMAAARSNWPGPLSPS